MRIHETRISGVLIVECDVFADDRGAVMPAWVAGEFAARGLHDTFVQWNIVRNHRRGTLRGMHYQRPPLAEVKLVRATRGAIFDVAVDLRPDSPTFLRWHAEPLSADNGSALLIPPGFAHGFQALSDHAELLYCHSAAYVPAAEAGLHPADPRLSIAWPLPVGHLSPRDAGQAWLTEEFEGVRL